MCLLCSASRVEPYLGNPKEWTIEQTANWVVSRAKLSAHYRDIFIENEINGVSLLALKKEDLLEIGVSKVGPLTALISSVTALKKRFNIAES